MPDGEKIRYLVTGGAGFIGSHLTEELLARGNAVIALDDLTTGRPENLRDVHGRRDFRFVHGSVLDEPAVDDLIRRCDVVVHLAAAVGVRLVVERPLEALDTNIRGSQTVIEAANRHHRKILIASTSDIYGKNPLGPLSETADRVLGPPSVVRWAYGTAKVVGEVLAGCHHREHGLPTIVVRLFNTVGRRQSAAYGMVVPRLVRQALRSEPLTVFGDGRQTRCFAHVADVVDALIRLLDEPAAIGQTFNVGSNQEISIRDLAKVIIARTGSASPIRLVPYDQVYGSGFEDIQRRVPDTARLRALTGWRPRHSLDDIIDDVIDDAQRHRKDPAASSPPSSLTR